MKVLSLFAGIGGIDLGLETLGWETVAFSEHDPKIAKKKRGRQYAVEVMAKQFPGAVSVGDIETLKFARNREGIQGILRHTFTDESGSTYEPLYKGDVDIIAGGFPCQDISLAGKGAGIEEGTRSGLWRYFAEAISGLQPRGVIIENVSALAGKGLDRVLNDLARIGYDAEWDVIAAAGVGAPHLRERLFILAWPKGAGVHGHWPEPPVFDNWLEEPPVPRLVAEDVEDRTARLRCLGNAVVPQCAAWVGNLLDKRIFMATLPGHAEAVDPSTWDAKHGRGEFKGQSKHVGWCGGEAVNLPVKLPRAGRLTDGQVVERVRSCPQAHAKKTGLTYMAATLRPRVEAPGTHTSDGLLTTPTANDARDGIRAEGFSQGGTSLPTQAARLVPTPTAKDADSSRSRTAVREEPPARESQMGETLTDYVDPTNGGRLLPTPQAADGDRTTDYVRRDDGSNPTLQGATKLLPTPRAADADKGVRSVEGAREEHERLQGRGSDLDTAVKLLPTPTVADAAGSRASKGKDRPDEGGLLHAAKLLPTPRACTGVRSSGMNRSEMMDALTQTAGEADPDAPFGLGGPVPDGRLLPTPIATDGEKVSTGTLARLAQFDESTAPGDVRDDRAPREEGVVQNQPRTSQHGRLNPEWVGWLMGFPPEWTSL